MSVRFLALIKADPPKQIVKVSCVKPGLTRLLPLVQRLFAVRHSYWKENKLRTRQDTSSSRVEYPPLLLKLALHTPTRHRPRVLRPLLVNPWQMMPDADKTVVCLDCSHLESRQKNFKDIK